MKKKGQFLIEATIAIALFAIVIIGIFQGLTLGIMGTYRDSQHNTALHLAQSQMEHVKLQLYADEYNCVPDIDIPEGFDCDDIAVTVDDTVYGNTSGLQLITVTVSYQDKSLVLQGYKTNR